MLAKKEKNVIFDGLELFNLKIEILKLDLISNVIQSGV